MGGHYTGGRREGRAVHQAALLRRTFRRRAFFVFQAEDGIRDIGVTGVQTCALPISRRPDPVLQQLETPHDGSLSVNDCFRPVSKYWDRVNRPEQLVPAALAAVRVLTNQAETGAVTLALPQDVQAEAGDYPEEFFERRVWRVGRPLPEREPLERAAALIRGSRRPMIVSGGGTIYSEATGALRRFVEQTGIPVGETQAGKGSLPYDHPCSLGADRKSTPSELQSRQYLVCRLLLEKKKI